MAKAEKTIVLHLSMAEAECLNSFLTKAVKVGEFQNDPYYEDWSWERTAYCMTTIAEQLPEAL